MKQTIISLLMLLLPLMANAEAVEINGIYYNLINKGKVAEVTENPNNYTGNVVIPSSVVYNDVTYSVTLIGGGAFQYWRDLTSVTIPNSVTSIGGGAFYSCSGLTSVTIPSSVTFIGSNVFEGCDGLEAVHITDLDAWCKIEFGNGEYSNPLNCAHHLYLNGKEVIDLVIPNSVTSIGDYAFLGCSGLTSVTIPSSVTGIGHGAFGECYGLEAVHITDLDAWCKIEFARGDSNPLLYAQHLYLNSKEIKELVIPNSVTSIRETAFAFCSGLSSVTIPNSVTSIGGSAFHGCI